MKRSLLLALAAALLGAVSARAANPVYVIETSEGTIKIELYPDKAPKTVKNFEDYVADKFFDGTVFHRIAKGFVIQGGGFEPGLKEKKTKDPIKNEAANGLSNTRGTLAMARTSEPDSATSQFFINLKDDNAKFLDKANARDGHGYCVFGKVTEGMDVVDKIGAIDVKGGQGLQREYPVKEIVIKSVKKADQ